MSSKSIVIAPRFVIFGAVCTAWLAAMTYAESAALHAAGRAWFTNWGIQIVVAMTSWLRPFSLPPRYYRTAATRLSRFPGVRWFGRIARRVNPLMFTRQRSDRFEQEIAAAETTHAITFGVVVVLMLVSLAQGSTALAVFLALWNVLFNLYPVALQRRNRARLRQVAIRRAQHTRSKGPALTPTSES